MMRNSYCNSGPGASACNGLGNDHYVTFTGAGWFVEHCACSWCLQGVK